MSRFLLALSVLMVAGMGSSAVGSSKPEPAVPAADIGKSDAPTPRLKLAVPDGWQLEGPNRVGDDDRITQYRVRHGQDGFEVWCLVEHGEFFRTFLIEVDDVESRAKKSVVDVQLDFRGHRGRLIRKLNLQAASGTYLATSMSAVRPGASIERLVWVDGIWPADLDAVIRPVFDQMFETAICE